MPHWIHHNNQLIYSYFYYCLNENIKIDIEINKSITYNGAIIYYENKKIFFDYSDDSKFIDEPSRYDYYFKRSLLLKNREHNIYPLNFNLPLSYKSLYLLTKLKSNFFSDKSSRAEIIRALDRFSMFTSNSHKALDVRRYPTFVSDYGGRTIFHTRLWNPDNHSDSEEKERRILQNEFRINACRIIKKNFENSSVGLFPDKLTQKIAPDLILDLKDTHKNSYFNKLINYNIGIADDGLKDTPGWKIGEYLLFGKAVITTPLNISLDNFNENENFLKLSSRSAYEELPDKIEELVKDKKYLEMENNNLKWSREFIHPFNYIKRILSIVDNSKIGLFKT